MTNPVGLILIALIAGTIVGLINGTREAMAAKARRKEAAAKA